MKMIYHLTSIILMALVTSTSALLFSSCSKGGLKETITRDEITYFIGADGSGSGPLVISDRSSGEVVGLFAESGSTLYFETDEAIARFSNMKIFFAKPAESGIVYHYNEEEGEFEPTGKQLSEPAASE